MVSQHFSLRLAAFMKQNATLFGNIEL